MRIPQYLAAIRDGEILPEARPSILRETAVSAVVDGNWAFGHVTAAYATDVAVEKAKATGVGMVGAVRCNHIGRLGEYGSRAASAAGC